MLSQAGIPNVLGVPEIISADAVAKWTECFYRHLTLEQRPLIEAATLAREYLRHNPLRPVRGNQKAAVEVLDWLLPFVYASEHQWTLLAEPCEKVLKFPAWLSNPYRIPRSSATKLLLGSGYTELWRGKRARIYQDGRFHVQQEALAFDTTTQEFEGVMMDAKNKPVYLHGPAIAQHQFYLISLVHHWVRTGFINHAIIIDSGCFKKFTKSIIVDRIRQYFIRHSIHHLNKHPSTPYNNCIEKFPSTAVIFINLQNLFPLGGSHQLEFDDDQARFTKLLHDILTPLPVTGLGSHVCAPHVIVQGIGGSSDLRTHDKPLADAIPFFLEETDRDYSLHPTP